MVERIKALSAVVDLFVIAEEGFVGVEALLPLVQVCEGRVRESGSERERMVVCIFLSSCVSLSSLSVCLPFSLSVFSLVLYCRRGTVKRACVWMSVGECASVWVGVGVSLLCVCLSLLCLCLSFSVSLPRSRSRFLPVSLFLSSSSLTLVLARALSLSLSLTHTHTHQQYLFQCRG